ncbi:MAG: hypothetical protein EOP86_23140, partial [Verrucomicrobiaceae bacterium]
MSFPLLKTSLSAVFTTAASVAAALAVRTLLDKAPGSRENSTSHTAAAMGAAAPMPDAFLK